MDAAAHLVTLITLGLAIIFAAQAPAAEMVTWAPYKASILRVDDQPPKVWNIYYDTHSKENQILLVQWGNRYLRVDSKTQEVREMDAQSLTHKNDKLTSPSNDSSGKILPSTGWIARNVGSAWRVYFELTDEHHTIDINLPYGGR
jgi:hypothetical protein